MGRFVVVLGHTPLTNLLHFPPLLPIPLVTLAAPIFLLLQFCRPGPNTKMEYRVHKIVGMRRMPSNKKRSEFRVEWWGYSTREATWEPASRVKNLSALEDYLKWMNRAVLDVY